RYLASGEQILRAKSRAMILGCDVYNIYGSMLIVGGMMMGTLVGGLTLGIWSGICIWKKCFLSRESEIREKLNNMMIDAINAYDKGEHQKFLDALSREYEKGVSLLKLEERSKVFDPASIIDKLLAHGFRSDGVAFLLNLLGEVFISGNVRVETRKKKDLKALASDVFHTVVQNKRLKTEAKKLDDRIYELRKSSYWGSFNKVKDFIFFNEYSGIAQECISDAQEIPIQSRLEEICNIARINLAIIDIIDADQDDLEQAVETIKD